MKSIEMKIISCVQENNFFSFVTDGGITPVVSFISENTASVKLLLESESMMKSYAIEGEPNTIPAQLFEDDESYTISCGGSSVKIGKSGLALDFIKDGRLITSTVEYGRDGRPYVLNSMDENEHFYGLGEDNQASGGRLDRRGSKRRLETGQKINIGCVTADIPVSFFISVSRDKLYGLFADSSYAMDFDMGATSDNSYRFSADGGIITYYVFFGDSFADILNEYTKLTGRPSMPPLWALGYIQCRCSYHNWEQVDEIISTLEKSRFPLDCMVFDFDWAEYFQNFKWNKRWGGVSPQKISEHKKNGVRFMLSTSGPMIRSDSDNYQSALNAGILAHDGDGNTVVCGHYGGELMDFTNPDIKEWLRPSLNRLLDDGIDSWWLDLTEPEGDPDGTVYHDGEKKAVHNVFSLMNTKVYNEITLEHNPDIRPFILTRTGTAGIQKYNAAIWSGDVFSDYKTFTAHIPEAMNTAMSGIPLWTSDSGGFMSSTSNSSDPRNIYKNDICAHAGLYERWLQFACFCQITRVHHAGESAPYMMGGLVFDSVAHYVRLRYRLLPYIYTYSHITHTTGTPLMRALVYDYPEDENVYDIRDEFLFGRDILVAPVTKERASEREVYFPEGEWFDLDYGYSYRGGKSYSIYAPQNRIPVFIRAGAIIPTIDQVYHTKDIDWKKINVVIYPSGESEFEMYADDGISYSFETGDYTLTSITCREDESRTSISVKRSNLKYAASEYLFEIHSNYTPESVNCLGDMSRLWHKSSLDKNCGWFWDDFNRILYIKVNAETEILPEIIIRNGNKIIKPSENGGEDISGRTPFILPAASLPCRIRCVNFDRGGEGVAYHKNSPCENMLYRTDGVEIELCNDVGAGYNITNLSAGEWMEYTVNAVENGNYAIRIRAQGEGVLSASFGDALKVESSLSLNTWQTVELGSISLESGEQILRIFSEQGCFRVNWIEFIKM